jgi:hypothetical protein
MGKKISRQTSEWVCIKFLLANSEFYSHLASWRVVIRIRAYQLVSQVVMFSLSRRLQLGQLHLKGSNLAAQLGLQVHCGQARPT